MPDLYVTFRNSDRPSDSAILVPGTGRRFIRYDIPCSRAFTFREEHRDGYNYGFATMPYRSFSGFWGDDPRELETSMFRVRLKDAERIFVVDEKPFLDARENPGVKPDITKIFSAVARTFVPLAEYRGNYIRPIYLIGRPLGADEAKIYDPPFRVRIRNEEVARQARAAPAQRQFIEDLFREKDKPDPPRPHLRLV